MGELVRFCGIVLAAIAACGGPRTYNCTTDAECVLGTIPGRCEENGFCSFPDVVCSSGGRYGDHAPSGIRNTCVTEPANDACISPSELALGVPTQGELRGAQATGLLSCSPQSTGDVFYELTLAECSDVMLRAEGAGGNVGVAMFADCATELGCADAHQTSAAELLTIPGVPAGTYQVAVDGVFFDREFTIAADVGPVPTNDTFATAGILVSGVHSLSRARDDHTFAGRTGGRDLYYALPLLHNDTAFRWVLDIDLRGHAATDFAVYVLDASEQIVASAVGQTTIRFQDLPSGNYVLAVDGPVDGYCSGFDLGVVPRAVEAGDRCTSARSILPNAVVIGDTRDATHDYVGSCGGSGSDLVYELTIPSRTHLGVVVTELAGGFTPFVYVRRVAGPSDDNCGSAPEYTSRELPSVPADLCDPRGNATEVFSVPAEAACATGPSAASLDLQSLEAGTYHIVVDSEDGAGRFELRTSVIQPAAENRPGMSFPLDCGGSYIDGDNVGCCHNSTMISATSDVLIQDDCGALPDTFHVLAVPANCFIEGVVNVASPSPHDLELNYVGGCTGTQPVCHTVPVTQDGDGIYRSAMPVFVQANGANCRVEIRVLGNANPNLLDFYIVRYNDTDVMGCL